LRNAALANAHEKQKQNDDDDVRVAGDVRKSGFWNEGWGFWDFQPK
jgi:hypothetical protein